MINKASRKAFELLIRSRLGDTAKLVHRGYANASVNNDWQVWQASREALQAEKEQEPSIAEILAGAGVKLETQFVEKQPLSTERAELGARLLECLSGPAALTTREATAIKDAADMLEADLPKFDPLSYMASNKKCYDKGVSDGLKQAQQVAVPAGCVPMTTTQIRKVYALVPYREMDSTVNYLDFARAIEQAHGITPQGDVP